MDGDFSFDPDAWLNARPSLTTERGESWEDMTLRGDRLLPTCQVRALSPESRAEQEWRFFYRAEIGRLNRLKADIERQLASAHAVAAYLEQDSTEEKQ